MTDKAIEQVLERWDLVMKKLAELCPQAYGLYVRQAVYIDGVVAVLVSAIVLCVVACCVPRAVANYRRAVAEYRIEDADIGWAAVIAGLFVIGFAASVFAVSGVAHLLNPQYYALRALIGTFVK